MSDDELKKEAEESDNELVKEIIVDTEKYGALEAVYLSEGGKLIIKSNIEDVVSKVETLASTYSKLTLEQFISIAAEIKTKLDIVRVIANSPKNKADAVEALKEALKA